MEINKSGDTKPRAININLPLYLLLYLIIFLIYILILVLSEMVP